MRHAILGAGGVGGLVGACLAHAGESVTLVVRHEALANYPKELRLESPFGNFVVDVAVAVAVPPVDVLWLTVKATQMEAALTALKNPDSVKAIVPLLNGIDHVALLRARYGSGRVIPATIAGETERVSPGHIVHRSPFARLNVLSAGRALLGSTLDQLQKIGFTCRFIPDEPTLMWGKLVFLAPFALSTTAADKTVGEILSDPEWRSLGVAWFGKLARSELPRARTLILTRCSPGLAQCPETCAAPCRKMWNTTNHRSWMRSQGRSCVALASTGLMFQPRKS
jgi:2-dehydropantoate 2-reductase